MKNSRKRLIFVSVLVLAMLIAAGLPAGAATLPPQAKAAHKQLPQQFTGETAYAHVYNLSEGIGPRVAGTEAEHEAALYIKQAFEDLGYETELQPFTYQRYGTTYSSQNVIATKPGRSSETIVVGAHYDSVSRGKGAGDNASGVGVMLEAAALLKSYPTWATVVFIAFGAEEVGLRGSNFYVSQLSDEEIANTIAMINMDMVGIGDYLNVYSGSNNGPTWVREMAMDIARNQGIDIHTTGPDTWNGATGDWSDHVAFRLAGIPIAYFEYWNWYALPGNMDGIEIAGVGNIYHTNNDTIAMVKQEKLRNCGKVVTPLIYELAKTPLPPIHSQGRGKNVARYKAVEYEVLVK